MDVSVTATATQSGYNRAANVCNGGPLPGFHHSTPGLSHQYRTDTRNVPIVVLEEQAGQLHDQTQAVVQHGSTESPIVIADTVVCSRYLGFGAGDEREAFARQTVGGTLPLHQPERVGVRAPIEEAVAPHGVKVSVTADHSGYLRDQATLASRAPLHRSLPQTLAQIGHTGHVHALLPPERGQLRLYVLSCGAI